MIQHDRRQDPVGRPTVPTEIVAFPVEADVTCSEAIGEALRAAFRPGVSVVIADMSATEFCDSSVIRHLILANKQAARMGAELRVVSRSPVVRRALHVLQADQLLSLYADTASALTGVTR